MSHWKINLIFRVLFVYLGPSLSVSELPWKRKPKLTEPADFHVSTSYECLKPLLHIVLL